MDKMRSFFTPLSPLLGIVSIAGGALASLFGGWDFALQTLLMVMAIDYITGFFVAGVFKKSPKSPNGTLESHAGWKGLCRKGVTLLIVLIAVRLDLILGSDFIRDTTIIAFVLNEILSITENAGLMGLPMPNSILKAIDVLKGKSET